MTALKSKTFGIFTVSSSALLDSLLGSLPGSLLASFLALGITFGLSAKAEAADVFVRDVVGTEMSKDQRTQVTDMVKSAVRQMPEHTLVQSEGRADFVLQPSIVQKGDDTYLRIERRKDGDLISQSEERIDVMSPSSDRAIAATENVMQQDQVASAPTAAGSNADLTLPSSQKSDKSTTSGMTSNSMANGMTNSSALPNASHSSNLNNSDMHRHSLLDNDSSSLSGSTSSSSSLDDLRSDSASRTPPVPSPETSVTADSSANTPGGDVRAPSPIFQRSDRMGTFQVGVGPAFGLGMKSDQILYDVNLGYSYPVNDMVSAKGFGDLNLASGADANRFLNFGLGADVYPMQSANLMGARPYITGDLGYAFTRDAQARTADAPAVGAGAGFKFAAQQMNLDVNLHYTILTTKIQNDNPSILGIRAALNF